jgi:hypothetical protein
MTDVYNLAYFAELDEENTVLQVLVVDKKEIVDDQGNELEFPESEPVGQQFLTSIFGPRNWKQTDYTYPPVFRKETAVIGGKYDPVKDEFYDPFMLENNIQSSQLF